jgi:Ni/Co efflux regulator RcnB
MHRVVLAVAVVALFGASVSAAQDQNNRPSDRDAREVGQSRSGPSRENAGGRPGNGSRPSSGAPNRDPGARPPAARPPDVGRPTSPWVHPRPPHRFMSEGRWRRGIRGPAFRYPPGYGYRHWSTGLILPPIFLSPPYYYDQYAPLGLGPPPAAYRWVRYGPDLLLVNIVTGRIADVVDGVFY